MQSQYTEAETKFGWSVFNKNICKIFMDIELFYKNVCLECSFYVFPNI